MAHAHLNEADLYHANLQAADLTNADLTHTMVTTEQLAAAVSLKDAIMPDGTKHG